MIGDARESPSPLRVTGAGIAGAGALFVGLLVYCKMHGYWGPEPVPLAVSARWAASGSLCWSVLLLTGWTHRARLLKAASGSAASQSRLFALFLLLALVTDALSVQLAGMTASDAGIGRELLARMYGFAPTAAMISAIAMLSLVLWGRTVPRLDRQDRQTASEWIDFPEAPLLRLRVDDIRLIRSAGNYSEIVGETGTWLVRAPLSDLAARLFPKGFVRVHRRVVINARHVRLVSRDPSGRPAITLSCGGTVSVGRSYRDQLDHLTIW
jgi:hypothetical protein